MDQSLIFKKEPLDRKGAFIYVSKHHTFGTDALLLANFAEPKKKDKYIDLCTGCGIIPFVLLRDKKVEFASAVDISEEAINLCKKTAEEQGLKDKINPVLADIKDLPKDMMGSHTLVTCNPPYFEEGKGLINPDSKDATARHEVDCSLDDVLSIAFKLLNTSGRFCMCHTPSRLTEILKKMSEHKLEPKRIRFISQRFEKKPFLVLVEGKKCSKQGITVLPTLSLTECEEEVRAIYGGYKEGYELY